MIVVEYHDIEVDHCINCKGVWFDSGELELLLKLAGIQGSALLYKELTSSPVAKTTEKKRKCPICNHKMKKICAHGKPELIIDFCEIGDGLWFDGGEYDLLISEQPQKLTGEQDSEQQVINFLEEVFQVE
jgi:Zn-finger nucleic acid-binding protein